MKRHTHLFSLLAGICCFCTALAIQYGLWRIGFEHLKDRLILILFAAGFACIFLAAFLMHRQVSSFAGEHKRLSDKVSDLTSQTSFLHGRLPGMKHTIESLSAMREISRAINIHIEFEKILEEVLAIFSQVTGALEINIFLTTVPESAPEYPLKAHFSSRGSQGYSYIYFDCNPEKTDPSGFQLGDFRHYRAESYSVLDTVFTDKGLYAGMAKVYSRSPRLDIKSQEQFLKDQVTSFEANTEDVAKAIEIKNIIRVSNPGLQFTAPLIADQKVLGVVKMNVGTVRPGDDPDVIESILRELCMHISLAIKKAELYERAVKDHMTRLYNKAHLLNQLSISITDAKNSGTRYSILMIDIDHFKNVNDTYGHLTGDIVLTGVANVLRRNLRENDLAFRYGGEELVILLSDTGIKKAGKVANRIRKAVKERTFTGEKGKKVRVTISVGVSQYYPDVMNPDPESFISRADEALYKAKTGGRDKVVAAYKPRSSLRE